MALQYNGIVEPQVRWQIVQFDTPHLKEPIIYDMNILPKDKFMPYMEKHLQYMHDYQDDTDRTKFSSLEVEKFRRVVDYMRTTNIEPAKLEQGRRDFARWFTEFDKRRDCSLVKTFPEMEEFYNDCKVL